MDALIEKSKPILLEAVECDKKGLRLEAVGKYVEGISVLMQALSCSEITVSQKQSLKVAVGKYMTRAECLKRHATVKVDFIEQLRIKAGSTGYGYDRIFAKCVDETVTEVSVDDAYIRVHHQILNFIRFCEFCVLRAENLKLIKLKTQKDEANEESLMMLKRSFEARNLRLEVTFDQGLHDREIRFDNGWIIRIGRGLDYFRSPGRYALGTCDLNLRECYETNVEVFRVR